MLYPVELRDRDLFEQAVRRLAARRLLFLSREQVSALGGDDGPEPDEKYQAIGFELSYNREFLIR